jgi:hypothetical protein
MSLKCKNAEKACNREGNFKKCAKLYRETCEGTMAEHCDVRCLQKGFPCPIETANCRKRCLKHVDKFKIKPKSSNGLQSFLAMQQPLDSRTNDSHSECHLSRRPNTGYEYDDFDPNSDCPVTKPYWAMPPPYGPSCC